MSSQEQLSRFSALELIRADATHARDAALLEIAVTGELRQAEAGLPDFQLPLTYGRLAIAEEKLGDHEAEQKALDAVRRLTHRPGTTRPELTDDQIKQWVTKLSSVSVN